jgi:hypothetical protein
MRQPGGKAMAATRHALPPRSGNIMPRIAVARGYRVFTVFANLATWFKLFGDMAALFKSFRAKFVGLRAGVRDEYEPDGSKIDWRQCCCS